MKFIVDAQLPPALARALAAAGHEAVHVFDLGMWTASDTVIWNHALATGSAIVTKDEDFAVRAGTLADGPPVVWLRLGNTTRKQVIAAVESVLPRVVATLGSGEKLVVIAR